MYNQELGQSLRAAFVTAWPFSTSSLRSSFMGHSHFIPSSAFSRYQFHVRKARHHHYAPFMSANGSGPDNSNVGIIRADLKQEMTRSYMEYAMSVILGRAMPDVRDGLKPVHRRILYAMHELSLSPTGRFRKSARVVGEVLGKFHPHGDTAVYDALVRMAQPFSMSVPLINGHGNFGSTDGDPAAAMRYTECKLTGITKEVFLSDMDRSTVDYVPNFDGSETEPLVLPARVPNLLVNGSSGIAVGMATNIPPHNLGEVVSALKALIQNPDVTDEYLMQLLPAPDFPTGGQILGTEGARDMYLTGRGRIVVRACTHSEVLDSDGGSRRRQRDAIIVTQLPYQVNKAVLVGKIADLVNEKKVEGISDLRDESDRNGTRIVIELKRDAAVPVVLNNLFKKTQLQSSFSANVMALDSGRFPIRLTLRAALSKFLAFRRETVRRRISHDLRQAEARFHIVQGFLIVQEHIDKVVAYIRQSEDGNKARKMLMDKLALSERQADAVLSMQLRRLTSLEQARLMKERSVLESQIKEFNETLQTPEKLDNTILSELTEIATRFSTPRKSVILREVNPDCLDIDELSLLSNDQSIITVTQQGYIKRMPTSAFQTRNRGARGIRGAGRLRKGDEIAHFFSCMSHDSLIAISKSGVAYQLPAHKVPLASIGSRGVPIFQLLPAVPAGETMASVLAVTEFSEDRFLVLLTRRGYVKKTAVAMFETLNARGKRIIALGPDDELKWVRRCTAADSLLIASRKGLITRFRTDKANLRASGRLSRGVISMRMHDGDEIADTDVIVSADEEEEEKEEIFDDADVDDFLEEAEDVAVSEEEPESTQSSDGPYLVAVTRLGTGKRVRASSFALKRRGGMGIRGIKLMNKDGDDALVAMQICQEDDSIMVVTRDGTIVRTRAGKIPVQSRHSRGVRIQRLEQRGTVAAVAVLPQLFAGDDDELDYDDDMEALEE